MAGMVMLELKAEPLGRRVPQVYAACLSQTSGTQCHRIRLDGSMDEAISARRKGCGIVYTLLPCLRRVY